MNSVGLRWECDILWTGLMPKYSKILSQQVQTLGILHSLVWQPDWIILARWKKKINRHILPMLVINSIQCTQKFVRPVKGSMAQKSLSNEAPCQIRHCLCLPAYSTQDLISIAKAFNVATLGVCEPQATPGEEEKCTQNDDFDIWSCGSQDLFFPHAQNK